MSVIAARAALDEALRAVEETRRIVPDSPFSRMTLAAAWDARCALRRAVDAACQGDDARVASAAAEGRAAAFRASEVAAWAQSCNEGATSDGPPPVSGIEPGPEPVTRGTGFVLAPGSLTGAPRSPRA